MKIIKILVSLVIVYVGIIVAFESLLGYFQPANQSTLVITTTNADGIEKDRVLARLESQGKLYVAANHWPRAWYKQTLAHPDVKIDLGDDKASYTAISVEGAEHDQVNSDNALGLGFRVLTGFPPRYFFRLEKQ